jgi:mannose-1-phosphate guanylyltransferase
MAGVVPSLAMDRPKAVVLVGGEGTRLRPLTETVPKPLLPLVGRPFLHRVLDHLAAHGVHEAVLSSPYLEETFGPFIDEREGDPKITWITEAAPLGTGGAVVNALEHLDGTFFVLNGDILTDLDLTRMAAFHRERAAAATISLARVADARPFGLVATDLDQRVVEFREKPAEPIPGDVNAGTYVLEPEALAEWEPGRTISVEREIFPALIGRGDPVFGYLTDAYWMDLGTPEKYLQANFDVLEGRMAEITVAAPFVAPSASVDLRAHLGRRVVVGDGASVGADAEVEDSVLHRGALVEPGARVRGSILGPRAVVGSGAVVDGCVLGEGSRVEPGGAATALKVIARPDDSDPRPS